MKTLEDILFQDIRNRCYDKGLADIFGMKLFSTPIFTKTIDHGIRRRVLPDQIIWERWIEKVPDNNVYILPNQNMVICSSFTMEALKKSMAILNVGAYS